MSDEWFADRSMAVPDTIKRNIGSIAQLEQEFRKHRSPTTCLSDRITALVASPWFIAAHVLLLAGWILANSVNIFGIAQFDCYPFGFLGLCLGLESMLLTTFVLMSQKRQTQQADQWAHVALQLSLLSEQESTKMLQLLQAICQKVGVKSIDNDQELEQMIQATPIAAIVQELEKVREAEESSNHGPKLFLEDDMRAA